MGRRRKKVARVVCDSTDEECQIPQCDGAADRWEAQEQWEGAKKCANGWESCCNVTLLRNDGGGDAVENGEGLERVCDVGGGEGLGATETDEAGQGDGQRDRRQRGAHRCFQNTEREVQATGRTEGSGCGVGVDRRETGDGVREGGSGIGQTLHRKIDGDEQVAVVLEHSVRVGSKERCHGAGCGGAEADGHRACSAGESGGGDGARGVGCRADSVDNVEGHRAQGMAAHEVALRRNRGLSEVYGKGGRADDRRQSGGQGASRPYTGRLVGGSSGERCEAVGRRSSRSQPYRVSIIRQWKGGDELGGLRGQCDGGGASASLASGGKPDTAHSPSERQWSNTRGWYT